MRWRTAHNRRKQKDWQALRSRLSIRLHYTDPVQFSATGLYGCGPDDEDDVYTVEEFRLLCEQRLFTDYDGFGYPVVKKLSNPDVFIKPSRLAAIPKEATHIVWFNR